MNEALFLATFLLALPAYPCSFVCSYVTCLQNPSVSILVFSRLRWYFQFPVEPLRMHKVSILTLELVIRTVYSSFMLSFLCFHSCISTTFHSSDVSLKHSVFALIIYHIIIRLLQTSIQSDFLFTRDLMWISFLNV